MNYVPKSFPHKEHNHSVGSNKRSDQTEVDIVGCPPNKSEVSNTGTNKVVCIYNTFGSFKPTQPQDKLKLYFA